MKSSDLVVRSVEVSYATYPFRVPIKFGGRVSQVAVVREVTVATENLGGKQSVGKGAMNSGLTWSWPDLEVDGDTKQAVTNELAARIADWLPAMEPGHPVDIGVALEEQALALAEKIRLKYGLTHPIPHLAVLVTISPVDAAVHDAYGKALGRSVYDCYGPEYMNHDLSTYLDGSFQGEYLDRYTLRQPASPLPLYHLVGALDPLTPDDVQSPVNDGYPETLEEWIVRDGLRCLKIKLAGDDINWDVSRVASVDQVALRVSPKTPWRYSLDFNEKCPNQEYVLDFFARLSAASPGALARIHYVEQPTARDLDGEGAFDMHEAAKVKPIVIDESLTGYESMLRAKELGYCGVALKACKGQSQSLLLGAAALKMGMFLCVQDLTCAGRAFAWSAGLAARIPTISSIEGNARQFMPEANTPWVKRFPQLFVVRDGFIYPGSMTGPGLLFRD